MRRLFSIQVTEQKGHPAASGYGRQQKPASGFYCYGLSHERPLIRLLKDGSGSSASFCYCTSAVFIFWLFSGRVRALLQSRSWPSPSSRKHSVNFGESGGTLAFAGWHMI